MPDGQEKYQGGSEGGESSEESSAKAGETAARSQSHDKESPEDMCDVREGATVEKSGKHAPEEQPDQGHQGME